MTIPPRALYICYFGLREPLVQTQVLPYLRHLVGSGIEMTLLTFEPEMKTAWDWESIEEWRLRLAADGIEWHRMAYHKRPSLPATVYDIVAGAWRARSIARRKGITLFHGRSHVGAAIGALARWRTSARMIFDFRGFLAEEYVDSGHWRAGGLRHRLTKAAERWLCATADGFVVLTEQGRHVLFPNGSDGRPVEVIPCCVDDARFAAATHTDRDGLRAEFGLTDRLVFIHVGVLGGYQLVQETADLLEEMRAREPSAYALLLTQGSPAAMIEELKARGFSEGDYLAMHVAPEEVPRYLRAADVALAVIRPSHAHRLMSPTKFGEYLAAGLPVIAVAGIGDLDAHIEEARNGVLLRSLDRRAYGEAFSAISELLRDPELHARCRDHTHERYALGTVGGKRYRRLYRTLLGA